MLNRRNFLNRGAQTLPILGVGMAGYSGVVSVSLPALSWLISVCCI